MRGGLPIFAPGDAVRPPTASDELVYVAKKEPVLVRDQAGCTFAIVQVDEADFEGWSFGDNPDC